MNRTIGALTLVVALGAMVTAGTGAFFSDSETSSNNILTAGALDLTVDHARQTYNSLDCETCTVEVKSDITNLVVEKNGQPYGPFPAVVVTPTSITQSGNNWDANVPDADWIWATDPVTQEDVDNDVIYTFEKTFVWFGPLESATVDFAIGADNSYEVYLNGVLIAQDSSENNHAVADIIPEGVVTPQIIQGNNVLHIKVKNWANPGAILNNPGGLKYKLTMNGDCSDSYFERQCRLWTAKDLAEGDTFYNFDDIKPGDWGTNLISLHVATNNAHTCLITSNVESIDATCVEPEQDAEDGACEDPDGEGELDDGLFSAGWIDTNMDGEHDAEEEIVWEGLLTGMIIPSDVLANGTTYVGTVWCAGELTIETEVAGYTCDGTAFIPGNSAQTDELSMDITAWAEQQRNNGDFSCEEVAEMIRDVQVIVKDDLEV